MSLRIPEIAKIIRFVSKYESDGSRTINVNLLGKKNWIMKNPERVNKGIKLWIKTTAEFLCSACSFFEARDMGTAVKTIMIIATARIFASES